MRAKFKGRMKRIAKYVWKHSDEECVKDQWFGDTRKRCSCHMCQNRRELEGPPISELRHLESKD